MRTTALVVAIVLPSLLLSAMALPINVRLWQAVRASDAIACLPIDRVTIDGQPLIGTMGTWVLVRRPGSHVAEVEIHLHRPGR